ncbi:MAG: hypothetical protein CSA36_02115 [Draconibacterium sp.]|nr:MAG: hypothetical protein CSA36_02115 [Draconibacterium sp.]
MKIQSKLTDVPETMLISIRARYLETKEKNGIIHDPKSVEILDQIACDFSGKKEVSKASQIGTSIRTEILDELTVAFLKQNPNGIVVNLGCGLDTRYYRLNNKKVQWFDLDLQQSIALRKNFFSETDNFKFIESSVLDFSWMEQIPKGKPTLFIAEGLFMYFTQEEVKSVLENIKSNFTDAEIILEAMSPMIAKNSNKHADIKHRDVVFKWGIHSGKEIEKWGIGVKFISEYFYFDRHRDRLPFTYKIMALFPFFRKGMKIIHLKFKE